MSDGPETVDGDAPAESRPDAAETATAQSDDGGFGGDVRRYVYYGTMAGLLLLGFVALLQFYLSAGSAISTWIATEYRQLFRAVFNLVVLFCVGAAVSLLLRRIERERA